MCIRTSKIHCGEYLHKTLAAQGSRHSFTRNSFRKLKECESICCVLVFPQMWLALPLFLSHFIFHISSNYNFVCSKSVKLCRSFIVSILFCLHAPLIMIGSQVVCIQVCRFLVISAWMNFVCH